MAGIGFTLDKFSARPSLFGPLRGFLYGALLSSGPWLFTVFALAGIGFIARSLASSFDLDIFRAVITYNFSFSLAFNGPIVMIVSRYLADRIYERETSGIANALVGSLVCVFTLSVLSAAPFYILVVDLPVAVQLSSILNYVLVSSTWLVAVFLYALRHFMCFTFIFAGAMITSLLATVLLSESYGSAGMITGFNVGLSLLLFASVGKILAEFTQSKASPFAFSRYFIKYWDLALSGFVYNTAIWIDKWIMWFAPDRQVVAGSMYQNPPYDYSMFLSFLTVVPALSLFTISSECGLLKVYYAYFGAIRCHASYARIKARASQMISFIFKAGRHIALVQGILALIFISCAPLIVDVLGGTFRQVGILRIGIIGAYFHILLLFVSIVLSYLDLRKINLGLQTLFLMLNTVLTLLSIQAGFAYYGYGYAAAAIVSFVVSFVVLVIVMGRLMYVTFISNNPSVQN